MQIYLNKVAPNFIDQKDMAQSQLWGQQIVLKPQQYVQIIAPSGSGKTSFIHFLYGMKKDYHGSITFDEENVSAMSIEKLSIFRQKKLSIVFQDLRLFQDLSVYDNITIKRQLDAFHKKEEIVNMAEALGIASKLHKRTATCSYGEQQRVAIIRSLMQPFEYLLLDEPFSHLDDTNRSNAWSLIDKECKVRNAALIFADLKGHSILDNNRTIFL